MGFPAWRIVSPMPQTTLWLSLARYRPHIHRRGRWRRWRRAVRSVGKATFVYVLLALGLALIVLMW